MRRKPDNKRSRKMGLLRAVSYDFGDRAFSIQLEEMGALIETDRLLRFGSGSDPVTVFAILMVAAQSLPLPVLTSG